jgi:hypothetical protein
MPNPGILPTIYFKPKMMGFCCQSRFQLCFEDAI